jgi:iron complex outermembrane recepter protein
LKCVRRAELSLIAPFTISVRPVVQILIVASFAHATPGIAQRAEENAVVSAEDAFGTSVGRESIGIYGDGSVRGFSPRVAGNVRIDGLYFDQQGGLTGRVREGSTVRVGVAAQADPFPAPTGLVDISLRPSGGQNLLSVLGSVGPYGSAAIEMDAQARFSKSFSSAIGVAGFQDRFANGGRGKSASVGVVPRWQVSPSIRMAAFWGRAESFGETAAPIFIPRGDRISQRIERGKYQGPDWAENENSTDNGGVIFDGALGSWSIKAGIFRSIYRSRLSFSNIIEDVNDTPTVVRSIFANPSSRFASVSGELRVARSLQEGPRQHLFLVSGRAREVSSRYGGSDFIDLGSSTLGEPITRPRPGFSFGAQNVERVQQATLGVSYGLKWGSLFDLRAGVQRTRYKKNSRDASGTETNRTTLAWLPNVTAALHVTPTITFYASFVRGLEENGIAPDFAANRLETLPALTTRQWDAGVQWKPSKTTNVVIGYYNVKKPYVTIDQLNVFRAIGTETHQGFEASLSTSVGKNLRIVVGGAYGDPTVSVDSNLGGAVGRRPVGQPRFIAQASVNYNVDAFPGFSVDGSLNYTGRQASNLENSYFIPSITTFDVGARYAFKLGKRPATLRVAMNNVANVYEYVSVGAGAFEPLNQRSISGYLTIDL